MEDRNNNSDQTGAQRKNKTKNVKCWTLAPALSDYKFCPFWTVLSQFLNLTLNSLSADPLRLRSVHCRSTLRWESLTLTSSAVSSSWPTNLQMRQHHTQVPRGRNLEKLCFSKDSHGYISRFRIPKHMLHLYGTSQPGNAVTILAGSNPCRTDSNNELCSVEETFKLVFAQATWKHAHSHAARRTFPT